MQITDVRVDFIQADMASSPLPPAKDVEETVDDEEEEEEEKGVAAAAAAGGPFISAKRILSILGLLSCCSFPSPPFFLFLS